jgi:hypothetical protein
MVTTHPLVGPHDTKSQLDELIEAVCQEFQISPSRYELAVQRYGTINQLLEASGSPFGRFDPRIYPQGSMALGTTVKPLEGPHDLDFVMELRASHTQIRPLALLHTLFDFLKGHGTYKDVTSLKNRCVRVEYADDFYLDILPACKDLYLGGTCISVPDRALRGWSTSNPEGYIAWFKRKSAVRRLLMEKAKPIPPQEAAHEKTPLPLCVQLLKRARDVHFGGPTVVAISVVLTTLAATHYAGERSVSEAMTGILRGIVGAIEAAARAGKRIEVCNPSNPGEDFGERWDSNATAYDAFREWISDLHDKWGAICTSPKNPAEALEEIFGEFVPMAEIQIADRLQAARKSGQLGVTKAGIITGLGYRTRIQPNIFHGDA